MSQLRQSRDVFGFFSMVVGFVWGLVSCGGFSGNGL